MNPKDLRRSDYLFPQLSYSQKTFRVFVFIVLAIALLSEESKAQCVTPNPAVESTSPNWTNFSADGDAVNDEFGIMKYEPFGTAGSKIIVYGGLVKVHTSGGAIVNVAENTVFDGTEDFTGSGEYNPLDPGSYLFVFKSEIDGRLGFLRVEVDLASIEVTEHGFQALGDSDGIMAGDCASLANALPVELSNFNARALEDKVHLSWSTATEVDNKGFEIQRSIDGENFRTIDFIEGQGNSQFESNYAFLDEEVIYNLTYYYRLKSVDFNGETHVTKTVSIEIKDSHGGNISPVFPNPIKHQLASLQIVSQKDESTKIALYDLTGKLIFVKTHSLQKGTNTVEFDLNDLNSGAYYFVIEMDGQRFTRVAYVAYD